jgi:hypothetical protein
MVIFYILFVISLIFGPHTLRHAPPPRGGTIISSGATSNIVFPHPKLHVKATTELTLAGDKALNFWMLGEIGK